MPGHDVIISAGLALGGGAARGWAHLGVIGALIEKNIQITHIAGTSIGAFVGAFVATNQLDILREQFLSFGWKQAIHYFASFPTRASMLSGHKITDFLETHLGACTLEDTSIPLCTVATDLRSGSEVTLSKGSIVEAVCASIAVPGIFTPVKKDDALLVDGGLVNPLPVSTVREMGAERVIAVDLNPLPDESRIPLLRPKNPNLLEIVGASANILEAKLTTSRLTVDPPEILIQPSIEHISYLDFSSAEESIELGYQAARIALTF